MSESKLVALPALEKEKKDSESKDSKDGSDSGVEVCVTEIPRVRKFHHVIKVFFNFTEKLDMSI